jgi:GT2 family glycosyltransferase
MSRQPTIAVVIATLGRPMELQNTLQNLLKCDPLPDEVAVIDGDPAGSAREAIEAVNGVDKAALLRHVASEPGLTIQRNRGLTSVASDVVLFIDDDVEVAVDTFAKLREVFADDSVVGASGRVFEVNDRRIGGMHSRVRRFLPGRGRQGSFTIYGYPNRILDTERPMDVEYMLGCFMAVRKEAALRVCFDERLPGYGLGEDEDFCYRLSRIGRIAYRPDIRVWHLNLGFRTIDRRALSKDVVVNRYYLFKKNFPQTVLARAGFALLICILFVHRIVNQDLAGIKGLVDGLGQVRSKG